MKVRCSGCGQRGTANDGWVEKYADDMIYRQHHPCAFAGIWNSAELPTPAEPEKPVGWKVGDRFTVSGSVETIDHCDGRVIGVQFDGATVPIPGGWSLQPGAALRHEAAPVSDTIPAPPLGAEVLTDARQHKMRIADLSGDNDRLSAALVKVELDCGDKDRQIARLRRELRDATERLRRRGGV